MDFEKEITVEVDASLEKLISILEGNGFKLKETYDLKKVLEKEKYTNGSSVSKEEAVVNVTPITKEKSLVEKEFFLKKILRKIFPFL